MKAAPRKSQKNIIILNTIYNFSGYGLRLLINLLLTPFIIHTLGVERFGIWAIIAIVTGYISLFDFGISTSYTKYLAEFHTKSEFKKISELVSTGFLVYFFFTLATLFVFYFGGEKLLTFFKISNSLRHEAFITLLIGIVCFGLSNSLSAFGVVPAALQRFDIVNIVSVCFATLSALCIIFVLRHNYGLIGLAVSTALITAAAQLVNITIAYHLIPSLRFNPCHFYKDTFFQLFRFGFSMQVAKISGWISTQIDKIWIGTFLSVSMVTYYELGSTVVNYALGISYLITAALLPALSQIQFQKSHDQLIDAYLTSLRHSACLLFPIFIFIAISSTLIMKAWMGDQYIWMGPLLTTLCLAFAINALAQTSASMCMAVGKPVFFSTGSIITIVLNTVLSFVLLKIFGFIGVAWGTVIAVNIGTLYFIFQLHQYLKIKFLCFFEISLPFIIVASIAAIPVFIFDFFYPVASCCSCSSLIIRGACFFGIYLFTIWKRKMLHHK